MFGHNNHLVLKITRGCNLRCSYCYIENKEKYHDEAITIPVLEKIIDRLVYDRQKSLNINPIDITLHGGEPTYVGKEKLEKILSTLSRKLNEHSMNYQLSMMTNLTLIDDEMAEILKKYNVSVGFSFDGLEGNGLRTDKYDDNFYIEKMNLLQKYRLNFGPLMVVTTQNYNNGKIQKTLNFLKKRYGITDVKVNYAEDVNSPLDSYSDNFELNGKDFFNNAWLHYVEDFLDGKTQKVKEGNLERYLKKYIKDSIVESHTVVETGNCGVKFCGGGVKIVEVEPDGIINYCGRYSKAYKEARLGTVDDHEFLELKSYGRYFDFLKNKNKVITEAGCDTCNAKNICEYGCMAFYYSKYGKWGVRKDLVCSLFKEMHSYFEENKAKILNRYIDCYGFDKDAAYVDDSDFEEIGLKHVDGFKINYENNMLVLRRN